MPELESSTGPRNFDDPQTVSGFVVALTSALPVGAAAIVSGAATAAVGETFDRGADAVNNKGVDVVNAAIRFADKHNEKLVIGAATGAATGFMTALMDDSKGKVGVKVAKGLAAALVGALAGIAAQSSVTPPNNGPASSPLRLK